MKPKDNCILLFDGVCNLCNGVVMFVIKNDRQQKIKFAALQSSSGAALLGQYQLQADYIDSLVYIRGGKVHLKSKAALYLLYDFGGLWKAAFVLRLIPVFIADWMYDALAKRRYQLFGKQTRCMVPTPEIKQRFLE